MDAGLYNLSSDQTSLDANYEHLVFNNAKRSCTGVSLSGGVFTFSAGQYLCFTNVDFTRTGGSAGFIWTHWYKDPTGTPEMYGGSGGNLSPAQDGTSGYSGLQGPIPLFIDTDQDLDLGPCVIPASGVTFTCNSAHTWFCPIKLDGPLVSSGLYYLSANQTNWDTAGEQLVWNATHQACSGVSLSSGAFTFTSDGIYVVMGSVSASRASGTGKTLSFQWTTDSTGAGTTAYSVGHASKTVTGDSTSDTGANAGCIAVVNRSGSNVTLGTNILAVAAATAFTADANYCGVSIWRLT